MKALLFTISSAMTCVGAGTAWAAGETSYAGQETRAIKALAPDDVAALLAGKGMGLAKAAELNGYPGPKHVLELADELQLSAGQRERTQALFDTMQHDAMRAGKALVEAERELDRLFAQREVTAQRLAVQLAQIGALQGQVRNAHLQAHLQQAGLLTAAQASRYAALRGYGGVHAGTGAHGGHHD